MAAGPRGKGDDDTPTKTRVIALIDQGHDAATVAFHIGVTVQSVYYHLRTCHCHQWGHPTPRAITARKRDKRLQVRRAYSKRKEYGSTWVRCRSCGRRGRTNIKVVGRRHVIDKCGECRRLDGEL